MNDDFLKVAKNAALKAGQIVEKYSKLEHVIQSKGRANDFATQADLEAEKIITNLIKEAFPSHSLISEEGVEVNNNSEYRWAIDPIDGTIGFVTGMPVYTISIALIENNTPIVGVIYNVALKQLYWANKESGAYLNGKKIHVSSQTKLPSSVIGTELGHTQRQPKIQKYLMSLIDHVLYIYILGGAAYEMALVASGNLDGTISRANIWDYAAGAIIVEEAGGKVTDHQGNPIDWTAPKIHLAATNGQIHQELLQTFNTNQKV